MLGLTKHGPRKADAETPSGSLLCVCAGVIARRDGCQSSLGITPAGFVVTSVDRYNVTLILLINGDSDDTRRSDRSDMPLPEPEL